MRYTTTLVLAIVVLAIVAALVVFWPQAQEQLTTGPKPREKAAQALPLAENLKMDTISSVALEEFAAAGPMKKKLAATMSKDGRWSLTEPVAGRADDYEIRRLLDPVVDGKYRQTLEPGAKDQPALKDLGLEPPAFRLTIGTEARESKSGKSEPARTLTVEIGRKATFGDGLYVRLADSKKVFALEKSDLLERAREKIETYRSRDLLSLGREDIVRIDLEGEKGRLRLDRAADGGADRWVLAQPLAARADSEAVSGLIRAALGANIKDFVDDAPAALDRFGLDKPRLTVTLYKKADEKPGDEKKPEGEKKAAGEKKDEKKADDKAPPAAEPVKAVTLKFGAWADPKRESVYAVTDLSKTVVSLPAETYTGLSKGSGDLRDKHVLTLDAARAAHVTLNIPAKLADKPAPVSYELVRADGAWKVKAADRPEAKADAGAVEALLKELADLKVIYFAEGEFADAAKSFTPQGSVRLQMEKESAPIGFEICGGGDTPPLVKNLREDWVGRINEKTLQSLRKDWLDMRDKQVLALDPKKAAKIALQTADRTVVIEKKGDKWTLTQPIEADLPDTFAEDRLADLQNLACTKFLAVTKDFKPFGLEPGELVATVTLAPAKEGEKPAEKKLRLAHRGKAVIAGRVNGDDLVFEAPLSLFNNLASEPLAKDLAEMPSKDLKSLDIVAGETKVRLLKIDEKWYKADAAGRPGEDVQTEAVDDILKAASGLKAVRWAAYDAKDPARFGLDKPAVRIQVNAATTKAALLISGKDVPADVAALFDQRPLRYAMAEGGQRIALVAGQPLETLLSAAKAFEPIKPEEKKPDAAKPAEPESEKKE